jgi:asparagine synthase (glutamine-hydrolysing)
MCGISGIFGGQWGSAQLSTMVSAQRHRGPDAEGMYLDPTGRAGLGHNRLSILDLSDAGRQPMVDVSGRYRIVFNGEVYNYLELRRELESEYRFLSSTDTEVLLAAYRKWGSGCLDRLIGMFAFAVWDEREQMLFAARDRLGVKPFYYHARPDGSLVFASEIKALWAAGVPARPDPATWATYLVDAFYEHTDATFWEGVRSLPPGHTLSWREGRSRVARWYDLAEHVGDRPDDRPLEAVQEEYLSLLTDSVRLRFRSDVSVGICLSGGLDSSLLLGLVQAVQGPDSDVKAFTFVTGAPDYDELPWVESMLARTRHPSVVCRLAARDVPALAESVQAHQDEPFGGLPTLAYARLFERARAEGTIVLLDGHGMDEQWAGYDYYARALDGSGPPGGMVQGTRSRLTRPECLTPEFRGLARSFDPTRPFPDSLRNLQYRDARYTKIPRALRFNDRVSMRSSTELREPFLDHRLFELALRQPEDRKIRDGVHKWLPRRLARQLLPKMVSEAPKRPLQTPQREWLQEELRGWAEGLISTAVDVYGGSWLDAGAVERTWQEYRDRAGDNSFFIWQWINLGLMASPAPQRPPTLS